MQRFRKKPVLVEAEQWLGTVEQKERLLAEGVIMDIPSLDGSCLVPTLEGNMTCQINDYIIKGIKGEYYPCKPDIFELTYDMDEKETLEIEVNAETLGLNPEFVEAGIEVGDTIKVDAAEDNIQEDNIEKVVVPVEAVKKKANKK